MLLLLLLAAVRVDAGVAPFPFRDDFELGLNTNYWTLQGSWGLTTEAAHSGANSLTDSLGANYANNVDWSATLSARLSPANRPYLSWRQRYAFADGDFGFIEMSRDGISWDRLFVLTGAGDTNWSNPRLDLSQYAGAYVLLRFRVRTDGQNQNDGWHIDDVEIKDNGAAPRYPLSDNMDADGSETNWLGSAWQRVSGSAQGPGGKSWGYQAGATYAQPPGYADVSLTLARSLDLAGAANPKIAFSWRSRLTAGSSLWSLINLDVSANGGRTWATAWSAYAREVPWTREQVPLSGYAGQVVIRFRVQHPYDRAADVQIDDVLIDDAPSEVGVQIAPGADPRHSARLTWDQSDAADFAYYAILRSTSPNMAAGTMLVGTITDRTTVGLEDNALEICGQTYYYRVLVWDTTGLRNSGLQDYPYRTSWGRTVTHLPFTDGLENGDACWALDGPWGLTTNQALRGTYGLADSPGGAYPNNMDRSATLSVRLSATGRPCLSFWQQYAFQSNQDFGFVEVSRNDGASWERLFVVTGDNGANWSNARLDLTAYAGSALLLRFRVKTDGQIFSEGWAIDEVEIKENETVTIYPFYDNMDADGSETNWLGSAWQRVAGSAQGAGGKSWGYQAGATYASPPDHADVSLTLATSLELAGAVAPKLAFSWRSRLPVANDPPTISLQVSSDGGRTWTTAWFAYVQAVPWRREQVPLSGYAGQVVIRFQVGHSHYSAVDVQIDDVLVSDNAAHEIWITRAPDGHPNPVHAGAQAQISLGAVETWGYPLRFLWTSSGGLFADSGTTTSSLASPVWLAPASGTNSYRISVLLISAYDPAVTNSASFVERLIPHLEFRHPLMFPNGQVQLTLSGLNGDRYHLQASPNPGIEKWTTLTLLTNLTGIVSYTDVEATNYSRRFYRAFCHSCGGGDN